MSWTPPPACPAAVGADRDASLPFLDLHRLRQTALRQALRATRGHRGRAAKLLGVHANTITRMLASLETDQTGDGTAHESF